ncbi:kinase-like domain-containing protein [Hyaloraphidium curvatum]|nr:kinase-like domain-containing protein [Hyaloraphidium curvatum]
MRPPNSHELARAAAAAFAPGTAHLLRPPSTPKPFPSAAAFMRAPTPPSMPSLSVSDPLAPRAELPRRHSAASVEFRWTPWRGDPVRRGSEGQLRLLGLQLGQTDPLEPPPAAKDGPASPVSAPAGRPDFRDAERFREGRMRRKNFKDIRLLGAGAEGHVKEVLDMSTGEHFALKSLRRSAARADQLRLATTMQAIAHPHVVGHVETFQTRDKLYVVCDLARGGDLRSYAVRRGGCISEAEALQVATIMLSTLSFLRAKGIVHRDLKPTNVLLRRTEDISSICLADFGSAAAGLCPVPDAQHDLLTRLFRRANLADDGQSSVASSQAPALGEASMKTLAGTPFYLAPEIVRGRPYDSKVDLWSLGCLLYELLYGSTPFQSSTSYLDLYSRICDGNFSFPDSQEVSPAARAFLARLLDPDPHTRPSADAALLDPWIISSSPGPHEREGSGFSVVMSEGGLGLVPEVVEELVGDSDPAAEVETGRPGMERLTSSVRDV